MSDTSYVYWNVGPELLHLGPLVIRWYGLFFALAFFLGYGIMRRIFRHERKSEHGLDSLLIYMLVGTVVGARLGHCLFYEPSYYLSHPLEILKVWKGGLASHGGAVGIFMALYVYSRKYEGQSYFWLLDRIAVPTALGGCLIRLGNLFNSEILGTATEVSWAFIFARIDTVPRHPAQLYESIAYFLIFAVLAFIYRKRYGRTPHGLLLGLFLVFVFVARFLIEFTKLRQASFGETLSLSIGQWLSIPMVFVGFVVLWQVWTKR